jgi:hypothetical protein
MGLLKAKLILKLFGGSPPTFPELTWNPNPSTSMGASTPGIGVVVGLGLGVAVEVGSEVDVGASVAVGVGGGVSVGVGCGVASAPHALRKKTSATNVADNIFLLFIFASFLDSEKPTSGTTLFYTWLVQ